MLTGALTVTDVVGTISRASEPLVVRTTSGPGVTGGGEDTGMSIVGLNTIGATLAVLPTLAGLATGGAGGAALPAVSVDFVEFAVSPAGSVESSSLKTTNTSTNTTTTTMARAAAIPTPRIIFFFLGSKVDKGIIVYSLTKKYFIF
jgi:hypothetical protein